MAPFSVLVVEDDEVDSASLRRAFARKGSQAVLAFAKDAFQAMEMLAGMEGAPLPLLILDQNMPKMSGLEFLSRLRAQPAYAGIPVVMLTTSRNEAERSAAAKLGVLGFFIKDDMGHDYEPIFALLP